MLQQVRLGQFKPALTIALSVLFTVASNREDSARVVVATVLQALVPVLTVDQVKSPVLPALLSLIDSGVPAVVKAAVKALTALLAGVGDKACVDAIDKEVTVILERGPKQVGVARVVAIGLRVCFPGGVGRCVWVCTLLLLHGAARG